MEIPQKSITLKSITLTKAEAATRQIDAPIEALLHDRFDVEITLAGAAEDMIDSSVEPFRCPLLRTLTHEAANPPMTQPMSVNAKQNYPQRVARIPPREAPTGLLFLVSGAAKLQWG